MIRSLCCHIVLILGVSSAAGQLAVAADSLTERVRQSTALLEGAENRFQKPDPLWFDVTRQALREETTRVDLALESHGSEYAAAWKGHLRWPNLVGNLGDASTVNVEELALVRRWLYSNREGLEYPFFAQLRTRVEAHLDAAVVFSHRDLESAFQQNVALARTQLDELATSANDAQAAALGRTLGWFEQTRQLPEEIAAVRRLVSHSNAQIVIAKPVIDRAIALLATEVEQTLPVSDRVEVPKASLLGRSRMVDVYGVASTHGQIVVELGDNAEFADVQLVYRGEIDSHCRTAIGPVTVSMQTMGPVRAVTPVQVSLEGVKLIKTQVDPEVQTRVTNVAAKNELFRRIGKRRVAEPESHRQMNSRASYKAASLLQQEMDERVSTVIDEIRSEFQSAKASFDSFGEVLAPVVREGATPRWDGIHSTADSVVVTGRAERREQLGAPSDYPLAGNGADVQVRLHVSLFNNMGETIMAGKTFTDKYFMRYGRILQAELPPPLMVHARSVRWSVVAAKPRPLEVSIPAPKQFQITLRMQSVQIGEDEFTGPTIATIHYELAANEFDEYRLERQGEVVLNTPLPEKQQAFLQSKMNAFFAPVLDAGGVALPEGGSLGRLRGLKPQAAIADKDWLTLGVNIPTEFLAEWLPMAQKPAEQTVSE